MKLIHIVNPVKVAKNHELYTAQPITFASIINAKNQNKTIDYEIVLSTTQFQEDQEIIPKEFIQLSNLSKSVNDVNFTLKKRKLPLIKDILEKTKEIDQVDYIIYSNVDIGLMPFFYESVWSFIKKGHDAIIINKRRLSSKYTDVSQLNEIYADLGKSHPGFDCFIFKASLLNQFLLDTICVGVPFSGVSLLHNILAFAENPKIVVDQHLTFHIGMSVLEFKNDEYYNHNKKIFFEKIQPKLKSRYDLNKFPYANETGIKRMLKWMLNPSIFTSNYLDLEGKRFSKILKIKLDELRWNFLQR